MKAKEIDSGLSFQDMSQNNAAELESQGSCHLWHDQKLNSQQTAATAPGSRIILPSPQST